MPISLGQHVRNVLVSPPEQNVLQPDAGVNTTSKEMYVSKPNLNSKHSKQYDKTTLILGDFKIEVAKEQANYLSIILSNYRKSSITIGEAKSSISEVMING